jgi:glycosyltransferase involved in cell wall biosynthesis
VRESRLVKPKLLFLAHLPPLPAAGGGQLRSLATLEILAERFAITLLTFQRPGGDETALSLLESRCAGGIHTVPLPRGRWRDAWLAARTWGSPVPWRISRDDSEAMRSLTTTLIERVRPAAVHVDHLPMAQFVPEPSRRSGAKVLLDLHNAEHRLFRSMLPFAPTVAKPLLARDSRRLEHALANLMPNVDAVEDRVAVEMLRTAGRPPVAVVPVGIAVPPQTLPVPVGPPERIATVATLDWLPNTDGLDWFARTVWPRLRSSRPGLKWDIAGVRANRRVRGIGTVDGIRLHGPVASVGGFLAGAAVFVAPVRCGAGIRIKVLDAVARGVPVVTSPLGAEGIAPHIPCIVVPEAGDWAGAIGALLDNPGERARLANAGRSAVALHQGTMASSREWNRVYDHLLAPGKPTP